VFGNTSQTKKAGKIVSEGSRKCAEVPCEKWTASATGPSCASPQDNPYLFSPYASSSEITLVRSGIESTGIAPSTAAPAVRNGGVVGGASDVGGNQMAPLQHRLELFKEDHTETLSDAEKVPQLSLLMTLSLLIAVTLVGTDCKYSYVY
jgi:hypothetical protein